MPDHILADLSTKAAEDISERLHLTAGLLTTPQDKFYIALAATASAAGAAVGFAQLCSDPASSAEEAADTMWTVLRPMIVMIAGGGSGDFRALVRAAPKRRV